MTPTEHSQDTIRQRYPITLLTGFLGSGKTTLLNRLLQEKASERFAIIVNEFGEISLDHLLVAQSNDEIIELANGCLCCAVRSDLVHTLFGLFAGRVKGEVPPFDRVLIETSGLADPAPILQTLFTDQALTPRFALDGVVVTIDAVNGLATLDHHIEALKQAAAGDLLLITKTDIAQSGSVERLKSRIRQINPGAAVQDGSGGPLSLSEVFGLGTMLNRRHDIRPWMGGHSHDHCEVHGEHGGGTQTLTLTVDEPIPWSNFIRWIQRLRELKGPGLLRLKGIANISDRQGQPLIVHAVQEVFHPPVFLEQWPSDDRRTRLVFILHGLSERAIAETFAILRGEA
jgi:G3E family GTPase